MENTAVKTKQSWKPTDVYQQVTDTIIAQLEKGVIPWQQSFIGTDQAILGMPSNFTTGKGYSGINILLLWCSALENEYSSNQWATYKQWNESNEAVRKDEKGHTIVKYNTFDKEIDGEVEKIPYLKIYKVFNRTQLASYQPPEPVMYGPRENLVKKIDEIEVFVKNTDATIEHKGDKPYYSRSEDNIVMPPPENFIDTELCEATEGYYSTLFHELTHWTGDPKRANRTKGKRFGDNDYAREELVAELGAAFLCSGFEIASTDLRDNAAYIDHWLKVLKEDKKIIFTAASEASKAVQYMQDLQPK